PLSPAARAYVTLGPYVGASWAASPTTGRMTAYKITAPLGGRTVTVWAQASGFAVNVTGPGTPYSAGCGPAGSRYPPGRAPASAGPGIAPDCGVLWRAPPPRAAPTVPLPWAVTRGGGALDRPRDHAPP